MVVEETRMGKNFGTLHIYKKENEITHQDGVLLWQRRVLAVLRSLSNDKKFDYHSHHKKLPKQTSERLTEAAQAGAARRAPIAPPST
ncbi:hypothetical protein ANCCEY_11368 [Ancylostoma ceylanicum]|uniref:Uncharacterized protein n=1 Tax=Ancylostoma ceylanicum TaxID=53326 RepID=A0A0D6LBT1_9BILA|nr:hypothetical protein ANCCEY_11368 [Ancylostoma ceylanicum]